MKKIHIILVALALCGTTALFVSAREKVPQGDVREYQLAPGAFHDIESHVAADIYIREHPDSAGVVKYTTDAEMAGKMKVSVSDGKLLIDVERGTRDTGRRIKNMTIYTHSPLSRLVIVGSGDCMIPPVRMAPEASFEIMGSGDIDLHDCTVKTLNLKIAGSGDIDLHGVTKADSVTMKVVGSGDIEADAIMARSVSASISGSGDVDLKGSASSVDLSISGSGDLDASLLKADAVIASLSGSGSIKCFARESIIAVSSGSGDITVNGKPSYVKVSGNKKSIKIK